MDMLAKAYEADLKGHFNWAQTVLLLLWSRYIDHVVVTFFLTPTSTVPYAPIFLGGANRHNSKRVPPLLSTCPFYKKKESLKMREGIVILNKTVMEVEGIDPPT